MNILRTIYDSMLFNQTIVIIMNTKLTVNCFGFVCVRVCVCFFVFPSGSSECFGYSLILEVTDQRQLVAAPKTIYSRGLGTSLLDYTEEMLDIRSSLLK